MLWCEVSVGAICSIPLVAYVYYVLGGVCVCVCVMCCVCRFVAAVVVVFVECKFKVLCWWAQSTS